MVLVLLSVLRALQGTQSCLVFFFSFSFGYLGVWPAEMIAGVLPIWPGLTVHITLTN